MEETSLVFYVFITLLKEKRTIQNQKLNFPFGSINDLI